MICSTLETIKLLVLKQFLSEGLSWDDVIAFGDSTNDIRMLEKADLGIAMGSASDFVKSFANRTTTSVYANGIFNAVKDILAEEE